MANLPIFLKHQLNFILITRHCQ